jgi:hypothetical protein
MGVGSQADLHRLMDEMYAELEQDLFQRMKAEPAQRAALFGLVDLLDQFKGITNARLQRANPYNEHVTGGSGRSGSVTAKRQAGS